MGLEIGKNLKNKIMQSKTMQNIVNRKSSSTKKDHNIKRNSLFSKIRSKVSDFRKKMRKPSPSQEIGQAIADIIEPITLNIGLEGIKTEAEFKKEFFKSLCGSSLDNYENPEVFFAQHPELSIRKEALQDSDIQNMVGLLKDATKPDIKTAFISRFSKTVKDSADNDISQGDLLTKYIEDIDNAINGREVKPVTTKETSPEERKIAEAFKILKQKKENTNRTTTELNNSFETLKASFQTISEKNKIKQDLEKLRTNSSISHLTIENLIKHINGIGLQYDVLSQDNKNILKDFGTLNTEITQTLKKIEDDIIKLETKTSPPNISSSSYQNGLQTAQKENQDLITRYQNNATQYTDILKFYNSFRELRQEQYNLDESPENKITLDIIDGTIANINTFLLNVPKIILELEEKQKELQTLSNEETLKQHIIAESKKLANIFDSPKNDEQSSKLITDFHESLKDALNNIILDDAEKTQTLQNTIDAIQNTLPPLELLGLFKALSDYKDPTDNTKNISLTFKNDNLDETEKQRTALRDHVTTNTSPHTIKDLKTLPEGQTHTLFASDDKNHKAINITKTGEEITISTHDFHGDPKTAPENTKTYTLNATRIDDAQDYLNEILKSEKTIYPKFSDINTTLDKFTKEYKTPEDIPLSEENINEIHNALYTRGSIENYWITLHETDNTNKNAINEKFKKLFPSQEIYNDFYTKSQKDGQPLTTLAMQYLAHQKWSNINPDNVPSLEILHEGMSRLSKPNNNSTNDITLSDIFKDDGDAILLDFNNNPTARTAGAAHYTGALIRKNADNDYTITTINTLREQDNEYRLTNPPENIENIIQQIYAKSTRGKNGDPKNAIPATDIKDIEDILTKDTIEKTAPETQTKQTGLRCGIEVVNRAIAFLIETENGKDIGKKAEEILTNDDTNEEKIGKILRNTDNKEFQRDIDVNGHRISALPPKFIFDRYMNPSYYNAPHIIEAKRNVSTQQIAGIFKCNESKKALFGSDEEYLDTYIACCEKTSPVIAIALLDYQDAENYKPLMESMQAGRRVHAQPDMLFSNEPTSFIFKTGDTNNYADHTIMTIIPQADNKYEIIFADSQAPNEQEIFTIDDNKKEDVQNRLLTLVKNCSERLMFSRYKSDTFPPTAKPDVISDALTELKQSLTHKDDIPLDEGTSYLDNINDYIKGKQTP